MCGGYAGGSGARGQGRGQGRWASSGGKSFLFSLEGPGSGATVGVAFRCCDPRSEVMLRGGFQFGMGEDLHVPLAQPGWGYCGGGGSRNSMSQAKFSQCLSHLGQYYGRDEEQKSWGEMEMPQPARSLVKEGPNFQCEELEVWLVGPRPLPE